ncbi:MAG TPA: hypothetical protein VD997_10930 [Phycisphaerales bacterium]|nr:hypothetical protein [Phycisphaerales bacterium]
MKSVIASLVAVAGMSVAASANIVNTQVSFLASVNGGPFTSDLNILAGQGVKRVEVVARFTYIGPGTALGFASAVFQPTVSGLVASDAAVGYVNGGLGSNVSSPSGVVADAPGQYGRISPYGRTALSSTGQAIFNHIHNGNLGAPAGRTLRIAQRSATAWVGGTGNTTGGQGVNVAQLSNVGRTASDPAFAPGSSVNVFRWGMDIDTGATLDAAFVRTLTVDAPLNGFGNRVTATSAQFPGSAIGDREVYWWGDMNASTGDLRGLAQVAQGFINIVVPSPASLALMGLGGLCVARRRR